MGVSKHTRTTGERVTDATIEAVDIADATITEDKFSEHLEHGTLVNISKGGRWKEFDTAFGAAPHVVISGESEAVGTYVTLGATPKAGSFKVELAADGTLNANYVAWGDRA